MEKYFKIGEISKLYNIGVDSLRYYEEIGIINPVRAKSGYRLYSTGDIWRLNVIRDLRELGFGMDKIKEYLDSHTFGSTLKLLNDEEKYITEKIERLKKIRKNVIERTDTLLKTQQMPLDTVLIKEMDERRCFSLTEGYSEEHEMDVLIKKLLNIDKKHFYVIGNNQIGTVIPLDSVLKQNRIKYQSVFIIDKKGKNRLPAGKYLSFAYRGEYSKSKQAIEMLASYAAEKGLEPTGDILEILWVDIHTSDNVNEHITELQLPVK